MLIACLQCFDVVVVVIVVMCMSQENATDMDSGDENNLVEDNELSTSSYCDSDVSTVKFHQFVPRDVSIL